MRKHLQRNVQNVTKEFKSREGLSLHKRVVHQNFLITCDDCGKKFTQKSNFNTHRKSVHLNERYDCNQCEFRTSYKSDLTSHKSSVHSSKKFGVEHYKLLLTPNDPQNNVAHILVFHEGPLPTAVAKKQL